MEYLLSKSQPAANSTFPSLEIHIALLRQMILAAGAPVVEIPAVPGGHAFIVSLTHDVDFVRISDHKLDHTLLGFLRRASLGSLSNLATGRISLSDCLKNLKAIVS